LAQGASLKDRIIIFLVSRLGALIILLLGTSWRLKWIGQEHVRTVWAKGQNVIYAFWHGRLLSLCYSHRRQKIHVMVSEHRDGEMIAQTIRLLGFIPVRGSTTRGGREALFRIVEGASAGFDTGITPDGPKGPAERVQPGVITLAQRTGMPILPLACGASFKKVLSSWDSFLIPLPFSRVAILTGPPIYVPRRLADKDVERKIEEVERAITSITRQADGLFSGPGYG
jgi:lysophospholipid acyltransferase (LPLAT)-like uncharacterized protein